MNDIEILEKQLDNAKYMIKKYGKDIVIDMDYYNALENLLKERQADKDRIKELEKENETLIEARNWYFEHFTSQACTPEQLRKILAHEYILKSLVKEKIKELTETKGDFATYIATSERIKVLQELL